jgi:hypothetical protein
MVVGYSQHGSPGPPQVAQEPSASQAPPTGQASPLAKHWYSISRPTKTQHPSEHFFPAQHGAPGVPQGKQALRAFMLAHVKFDSTQPCSRPAQQGSPSLPHRVQMDVPVPPQFESALVQP